MICSPVLIISDNKIIFDKVNILTHFSTRNVPKEGLSFQHFRFHSSLFNIGSMAITCESRFSRILEMSERKTNFTFHFSKRVKAFQISLFFLRKKSETMHVSLHFVMKNNCSQCGVASFQARNLLNGCTFNMG